MNKIKPIILGSCIVVAGINVTEKSALADTGSVGVRSHNPGTIDVASNGVAYTGPSIPLVSLSAQLRVRLNAGGFRSFKKLESLGKS